MVLKNIGVASVQKCSIFVFQCQYVSIPVTLFATYIVTRFTIKIFGAFWHKIYSKMFYIYRTKKRLNPFLNKYLKFIITNL